MHWEGMRSKKPEQRLKPLPHAPWYPTDILDSESSGSTLDHAKRRFVGTGRRRDGSNGLVLRSPSATTGTLAYKR